MSLGEALIHFNLRIEKRLFGWYCHRNLDQISLSPEGKGNTPDEAVADFIEKLENDPSESWTYNAERAMRARASMTTLAPVPKGKLTLEDLGL